MKNRLKLLAALGILVLISGCSRKEAAPVPADTQLAAVAIQMTVVTAPAETEAAFPRETEPTEPEVVHPLAQRIENSVEFRLDLVNITSKVADNNHLTRVDFRSNRNLILKSQETFGAVYMMWDTAPGCIP